MLSNTKNKGLPEAKLVKILTTENTWVPKVIESLIKGKPCILPTGCGAYILASAINVKGSSNLEKSFKAKQLLNKVKGRHPDTAVAYTIPPDEIPRLVDDPYRDQVRMVIDKLISKPFGIVAKVNDKVPNWLKVYDSTHGVYEKLFVWPDAFNKGPIYEIFKFAREKLGLSLDEFSIIASSANLNGKGHLIKMNDFEAIYDQLGDNQQIAYAVKSFNDGGQYSTMRTTIVSTLPFTQNRQDIHIIRAGSLKAEELKVLLPRAQQLSAIKYLLYIFLTRMKVANR